MMSFQKDICQHFGSQDYCSQSIYQDFFNFSQQGSADSDYRSYTSMDIGVLHRLPLYIHTLYMNIDAIIDDILKNWNNSALQCVSFCCRMKYISSIYLLPLGSPPHTSGPPQITRLSSVCYIAGSYQLSVLHMVMCICQSQSHDSSHPCFPLPISTFSFSMHVCSCPANRFIGTIFLDSTCIL